MAYGEGQQLGLKNPKIPQKMSDGLVGPFGYDEDYREKESECHILHGFLL
jgi:hypothetical protein